MIFCADVQTFFPTGFVFRYQSSENAPRRTPIELPLRCSKEPHRLFVFCKSIDETGIHHVRQLDLQNDLGLSLSGPMDGGSLIDISGQGNYPDAAYCRFTDAAGKRIALVSAVSLLQGEGFGCSSPPRQGPGRVSFQVINAHGRPLSPEIPFMYYRQPILHSVEYYSENIKVSTSSGMKDAMKPTCGFFSMNGRLFARSPATLTTEHEVWCNIPHEVTEEALVELAANGQDFTEGSGILFSAPFEPRIFDMNPSMGVVRGGTEVIVRGTSFRFSNAAFCRFNGLQVPVTVVDTTHVICTSPPLLGDFRRRSNIVSFGLVFDGKYAIYSGTSKLEFTYLASSLIGAAPPVAGNTADSMVLSLKSGMLMHIERGVEGCFAEAVSCQTCASPQAVQVENDGTRDNCAVASLYTERMRKARPATVCRGNTETTRGEPTNHDNVPLLGGTPVVVMGSKISPDREFYCQFGDKWTQGYVANASHLVCSSRPSNFEKMVNFHVWSEGEVGLFTGDPGLHCANPPTTGIQTQLPPSTFTLSDEGRRNRLVECRHIAPGEYLSPSLASLIGDGFPPAPCANCHAHSIDRYLSASARHFLEVPGAEPVTRKSGGGVYFHENVSHVPMIVGTRMAPSGHKISTPLDILEHSTAQDDDYIQLSFGDSYGGTEDTAGGNGTNRIRDTVYSYSYAYEVIAQVPEESIVRYVNSDEKTGQEWRHTRINGGNSKASSASPFEGTSTPSVTSLYPSAGVVDGGTHVKVTGFGFVNSTDLKCNFGSQHAPSMTYISAKEVVCEAPPSVSPNVAPVSITWPGMRSTSSRSYRYVLRASVLDASPREVILQESRELIISGAHFIDSPLLVCMFNGTHSNTRGKWVSANIVVCPILMGLRELNSTVIEVRVANNGQDISLSAAIIYLRPRSTIRSVSPAHSFLGESIQVKTRVHSTSEYLQNIAARGHMLCRFDAQLSLATVNKIPTQLCEQPEERSTACLEVACAAPMLQKPRVVSLAIVDDKENMLTNSVMFTYRAAPVVYSNTPSGPYEGGTSIVVPLKAVHEESEFVQIFGCQFWDAYDAFNVPGEVLYLNSTWWVGCRSPPWRRRLGLQTTVSVGIMADGVLISEYKSMTFNYSTRARIVNLSPKWGLDSGDSGLRIKGADFLTHGNFACVFSAEQTAIILREDGCSPPANGERISGTELACESPSCTPGLVYTSVFVDGIQAEGVLQYHVKPSTHVIGLTPNEGPAFRNTAVEVKGDNFFFTGRSACRFGLSEVPAAFVNSNIFLCVSPSIGPGLYPVSIALDGENFEDSGQHFRYLDNINIVSLSPTYGWTTGGTRIMLHLTGMQQLENSNSLVCLFGESHEPPVIVDFKLGRVVCASPTLAQASPGTEAPASVAVSIGTGLYSVSSSEVFTYVVPTTVITVIPDRGQAGSRVQIIGENFHERFKLQCQFGLHRTPATFVTPRRIDCHAPDDTHGQFNVSVLTGDFLTTLHTMAKFELEQPSVLFAINPVSGVYDETTEVSVSGSGFLPSADLMCRFGQVDTPAVFVNSSYLLCSAPPQKRDRVKVSTSLRGDISSLNSVIFRYNMESVILRVLPSQGSLYGGTVVKIVGNLDPTFVGSSCIFTFANSSSTFSPLELNDGIPFCRTPPSPGLRAGAVEVGVFHNGRKIASGASFMYVNPPTVHSIHPQTSYKRDGEQLVVIGQHFLASGDLACRFTNINNDESAFASALFISASKMSCIIPVRHSALTTGTRLNVDITTNGMDYTSEDLGLVLLPTVTISRVSPESGPVNGGTRVAIYGMPIPDEKNLACRFGELVVPAWSISDDKVVCISPMASNRLGGSVMLNLMADSREITTTGISFKYISEVSVVSTSWGTSSIYNGTATLRRISHLEQSIPTVIRCEPTAVSSGGEEVIVRGLNFVRTSMLTCSFGGVFVKAQFMSDELIKCVAPQHAPEIVSLQVSNDGTTFSLSRVSLRFQLDPMIFSIEPTRGLAQSQQLVTIVGNNFYNSSSIACRFGATPVPGFYVSSSKILCRAPSLEETGTGLQVQVSFSHLFVTRCPLLYGLAWPL